MTKSFKMGFQHMLLSYKAVFTFMTLDAEKRIEICVIGAG